MTHLYHDPELLRLRAAVVATPDLDAPRHAYAARAEELGLRGVARRIRRQLGFPKNQYRTRVLRDALCAFAFPDSQHSLNYLHLPHRKPQPVAVWRRGFVAEILMDWEVMAPQLGGLARDHPAKFYPWRDWGWAVGHTSASWDWIGPGPPHARPAEAYPGVTRLALDVPLGLTLGKHPKRWGTADTLGRVRRQVIPYVLGPYMPADDLDVDSPASAEWVRAEASLLDPGCDVPWPVLSWLFPTPDLADAALQAAIRAYAAALPPFPESPDVVPQPR